MSLRRAPLAGLAVGVTTALAASLLASPAAQAAPVAQAYDPDGVSTGAAWLESQLTDGVIRNDQFAFDDLGLTVDVGLALDEVGRDATVGAIADALAPQVRSYYTYQTAAGNTHVSAGSLAKATVFARAAGRDASDFGSQDLVAQLEERVSQDAASRGRISDVFFPDEQFEADFSNTIGQSFAARGLAAEGSPLAGDATEFLLAQQCEDGFFRLAMGSSTADTCDAADGSPSVDVTALAVLNLREQSAADPAVAAATDAALDWLASAQRPDGSFGSDGSIEVANANSTGLAGWALGTSDRTAAAERAATWVRGHQVVNTADCTPYAAVDEGAIAYDDAGLQALESAPLGVGQQDQVRRATSQALPALQWAPDGVTARQDVIRGNVRPGTRQTFTVTASPGDVVCASRGGNGQAKRVPSNGRVTFAVRMPKGTSDQQVRVTDGDELVGVQAYYVRGVKRFRVQVPATVGRGDRAVIVVTGMAPGEEATIRVRGARLDKTNANAQGQLRYGFRPGGKLGRVEVRVTGAFAQTRFGTDTFRLTR